MHQYCTFQILYLTLLIENKMTLLKIFLKQDNQVTVSCLPTITQTHKMCTAIQENVVAIASNAAQNLQTIRPYQQHMPVKNTVDRDGGKLLKKADHNKQVLKNLLFQRIGTVRKWADMLRNILITPGRTIFEHINTFYVSEKNLKYEPLSCFSGNYNLQKIETKLFMILIKFSAGSCAKFGHSHIDISTPSKHYERDIS